MHAYDHIDLPEIKPVVTRMNIHSGYCPCCGKRIAGAPPADMPVGSPFGPNVVALVVYLHTRHMVSFNRLVEMLKGLFGLEISEGAIANMLSRAAEPFIVEAGRIEAEVRAAPVIASDETSARVEGQTCWQWVFGQPRRWRTASQSAAARRWRLIFSRAQRRKSGSATGWGRRWATQRRIKCASPICCATPSTQLTPGINCLRRASSFSWGGRSSSAAGARVWRTARFWPPGAAWIAASVACWRLSPIRWQGASSGAASRNARTSFRLRHPP